MKIHDQRDHFKNIATIYADGIIEIERYLNNSKFHGIENNYVNPDDIKLRLNEIKNEIFRKSEVI